MTKMAKFWLSDPAILLAKERILELWPTPTMSFEEKLNSITRLVIFVTIIAFAFTMSFRILIVGIITVIAIVLLYRMHKSRKGDKEGFEAIKRDLQDERNLNAANLEPFLKSEFQPGTATNPFSNVLLTDIGDHPERKAAPPSFNPQVDEDIMRKTKNMIQDLNPTIDNTNKQLFGDLANNFDLDQSMRVFNSNANTRVANDQSAFAQFLYGGMISGKESALARVQDNPRYTLY